MKRLLAAAALNTSGNALGSVARVPDKQGVCHLRAITYAAVAIALLDYCQEKGLPHLGFVILDSPLLAYWKPEGEDYHLAGSDLKERFYDYLIGHHASSQIVVLENQHPPDGIHSRCNMIVFTKNPHQGRYGQIPSPTSD